MKKEIKEYYKLFYKADIDDKTAEELLNTKVSLVSKQNCKCILGTIINYKLKTIESNIYI